MWGERREVGIVVGTEPVQDPAHRAGPVSDVVRDEDLPGVVAGTADELHQVLVDRERLLASPALLQRRGQLTRFDSQEPDEVLEAVVGLALHRPQSRRRLLDERVVEGLGSHRQILPEPGDLRLVPGRELSPSAGREEESGDRKRTEQGGEMMIRHEKFSFTTRLASRGTARQRARHPAPFTTPPHRMPGGRVRVPSVPFATSRRAPGCRSRRVRCGGR